MIAPADMAPTLTSVVVYDAPRRLQPDARFGAALRSYRQGRNFSASDLARRAGVDQSYISRLERGKREPTLRIVIQVAAALDLSPSERIDLIEAAGYEIRGDE